MNQTTRGTPDEPAPMWLTTLSDMTFLMLVFFILLSLTEASFTGPPSIQAAVVLVCVSAAAQWRREPARVRVNAVATA